ncbi:MAG: glycosyltransferase [Pseudomonadota bacterium]
MAAQPHNPEANPAPAPAPAPARASAQGRGLPAPLRLSLVIHGLSAGGAERVMNVLADGWAARGEAVTLITLDTVASDFYFCDARVTRVGLGVKAESVGAASAVYNNFGRVMALRRALRASRPQVIISFTDRTNVLAILAAAGLGAPVIACEHIDPFRHAIGPLWGGLRRLTYPHAGAVVGVTRAAEDFVRRFVRRRPVLTLPNPIEPPPPPADLPRLWPAGPALIAMGRLDPQKNFPLLIRVFARVAAAHPDWRLVILGEGPLRAELTALAAGLGLAGRVHLAGRVADPFTHLRRADVFVMSSDYEGFPMSLLEAMSCGLPVVATDCCTGMREIVRPGEDGLLTPVGDADALALALAGLMQDPAQRAKLAAAVPQVCQRFGLIRILGLWDQLFGRVLAGRGRRAERKVS